MIEVRWDSFASNLGQKKRDNMLTDIKHVQMERDNENRDKNAVNYLEI